MVNGEKLNSRKTAVQVSEMHFVRKELGRYILRVQKFLSFVGHFSYSYT